MVWIWGSLGALVLALLVLGWCMDRAVRRRGSRVPASGDLWREVREGRRDADVVSPYAGEGDYSWTSWSRRNHR